MFLLKENTDYKARRVDSSLLKAGIAKLNESLIADIKKAAELRTSLPKDWRSRIIKENLSY